MRRAYLPVFGALALLLLLTACTLSAGADTSETSAPTPTPAATPASVESPESASETEEAPGEEALGIMSVFTAVDLDGNEVDQSIFADYALTMVNVWGTFCTPCIAEMPDLGELSDTYADKGVRVVGLISDALNADGTVSDSQLETAREIVSSTGADYLHIVPSEELFGLLGQITAVPTTFFVDSGGNQVGYAYLGSRSGADWAAIVDEMLAEVAP